MIAQDQYRELDLMGSRSGVALPFQIHVRRVSAPVRRGAAAYSYRGPGMGL
jgi:hypothetical protein